MLSELVTVEEQKQVKGNCAKRGKFISPPALPDLVEERLTRLSFRACCVVGLESARMPFPPQNASDASNIASTSKSGNPERSKPVIPPWVPVSLVRLFL